jgi:1-deoxy-D-xylulose-5-phosphate synthase
LITQAAHDAGVTTPVHNLGLPRRFLAHATRQQIQDEHGCTPTGIAAAVRKALGGGGLYPELPDQAPPSWRS